MGSLSNSRATTPVSEYDATKVATYNAALQVLDSLEAGKLDVAITTTDVTLTGTPAAPQAQNKFFNLSGTLTGNRSLIFPVNDDDPATGNPRLIVVKNGTAGAFTVTVKISGQTGVTITQGNTAILLHNGTDFVKLYEVNSTTGAISSTMFPAWTAVAFNAGHFTAAGSMTWTVDSADVTTNRYILEGKSLTWNIVLESTTVGGTLSNELRITIPGGFTALGRQSGTCWIFDNGVGVSGLWEATGTLIKIYRTDVANFTAGTNLTQVRFNARFEVQ